MSSIASCKVTSSGAVAWISTGTSTSNSNAIPLMEICVLSTIPCRKSARNTGRDRGWPVPIGASSSLPSSLVLTIEEARSWFSASSAACSSAFSVDGWVSRKDWARSMACGTISSSLAPLVGALPRDCLWASLRDSSETTLSLTCTPSTSTTMGLEWMADGIVTRSLRTFALWSLKDGGSCSNRSSFCTGICVSASRPGQAA